MIQASAPTAPAIPELHVVWVTAGLAATATPSP
jgi:hypothetical protein